MKIYTKSGDGGKTSLFGGERVSKADLRIEAAGTIDELTSVLGFVNEFVEEVKYKALVHSVQKELYEIMAVIAGMNKPIESLETSTYSFERIIDDITSGLPKLNSFIMPGGGRAAALFHVARAVCRRAERSLVRLSEASENPANLTAPMKYLNRLSDLLFTLARFHTEGKEIKLGSKNRE